MTLPSYDYNLWDAAVDAASSGVFGPFALGLGLGARGAEAAGALVIRNVPDDVAAPIRETVGDVRRTAEAAATVATIGGVAVGAFLLYRLLR